MRRSLLLLVSLLVLLAAGPVALAQDDGVVPDPVEEEPAPDVEPKDGKLRLKLLNGLYFQGKRYFTRGQTVRLRGRARPFVKGQRVKLQIKRVGRRGVTKTVRLRKAKGRNAGQFKLSFARSGRAPYVIKATHRRTAAQRGFSDSQRLRVLDNSAGLGSDGRHVKLLQKGLRRLGYAGFWPSGHFGPGTARAVLAFRKVNGLGRVGYASTAVFKRVFNKRGSFKLKYPNAGKHVETDLSRQVLVLAKNGKPVKTYHTSSGKASTPTVLGSFRFYRKDAGTNGVGMVHSNYFIGGYAIHGYHSVPTYPASHGCLRVPIPDAWNIYSWIDIGDRIFVYR